jgi:hypothetical protein
MKTIKLPRLVRTGWNGLKWDIHNSNSPYDFLEETDVNTLLTLISSIKDKMPTLKKDAGILIDKTSNIPRPKLKEFIEDNNLKKVTLLSKADVIIVKRDTIQSFLKEEIKKIYLVDKTDIKRLGFKDNENIMLHTDSESGMDQEYFDVKNRCTVVKGWLKHGYYRNNKLNESLEFIYSLVGTTATLVYDDILVSTLNKDGLDLDSEIYETLQGMLLSKDTATFNLGIEMLSNVNIENNLFKVSLLMNTVFNQTGRFNAMSQYNSKNFKSLLEYLDANKIRWNQKWEVYGMSMWNKFKNTEHADSIKVYFISNMNEHFKKLAKDDVALVQDILFK